MKIANNLIYLFLLCIFSFQVQADKSYNVTKYRTMQLQFADWLNKIETPITGFTQTNERTLIAGDTISSGGEIKVHAMKSACIAYAPHRFYDKYTYSIADVIFNQHCSVLIANTLHRKTKDENNEQVDLGKYQYSAANAFISEYAKTVDTFAIYQIHGFDAKKRKTNEGKNADVILSHGLKSPSKALITMSQCLNSKLNLNSLLYPSQVKELGATKNILNAIAPKNSVFFHLELSYQVRKRLVTEPNFMSKFSQCVTL
jgi:hypothetical protein